MTKLETAQRVLGQDSDWSRAWGAGASDRESHEQMDIGAVSQYLESQRDYLLDPTLRRDHFAQMSEDDWIDFIGRNESVIRYGDADHIQSFDADYHMTMRSQLRHEQESPSADDKEYWLRELHGVVRGILNDYQISDERALAYAAMVTQQGILLVHPFVNGNGRVSRLTSMMVGYGIPNDNALTEVLKESSGGRAWDLGSAALFLSRGKVYDSDGQEINGERIRSDYVWGSERSSYSDRYRWNDGTSLENAQDNHQRLRLYQSKDIAEYLRNVKNALENPNQPLKFKMEDGFHNPDGNLRPFDGRELALGAIKRAGIADKLSSEYKRIQGLDEILLYNQTLGQGHWLDRQMIDRIMESEGIDWSPPPRPLRPNFEWPDLPSQNSSEWPF